MGADINSYKLVAL